MDSLPIEAISYIFKYLPSLKDRKVCSLVCKSWYDAYQDPYFRRFEVLHIVEDVKFQALSDLINMERKYYNLVINGIEISERSFKFWDRYGPYIKNLSIINCSIREKVFTKIIELCGQLDSLSLQNCKELFMVGHLLGDANLRLALKKQLVLVKTLNLSYNRYLSDLAFNGFGLAFPNIKELVLSGCQISFFPGLYKKYYPEGQVSLSGSVLTFPIILNYLESNAKNIEYLSFNDTFIDNSAISFLAQVNDLRLLSLNLRGCFQLSHEGMVQLSNYQKSLTCLDVSMCPRITDGSMLAICAGLTNLKSLSAQSCRAITDLGLSGLSQLEKLIYLNISECDLIEGEGILKGLCHRINQNFKELYLSHLGNMTENVVISLSQSLPNLKTLDLGFCYNAVTNKSIQSVIENNRKLETLKLTMCIKLTDSGLTGMGLKIPQFCKTNDETNKLPLGSRAEQEIIREAKLNREVQEIITKCTNSSDITGVSLKNLTALQYLTLNGCNGISDLSLTYAFEFNDLRHLDLSRCNKVTEEGLIHLSKNNSAIESLYLGICHNVNDKGVLHLLKNLKRLESLTLGSSKVTDLTAEALIKHGGGLIYLDIRQCSQVSAEAINDILLCLPNLHNFYYTTNKFDDSQIPTPPDPKGFWWLRKT